MLFYYNDKGTDASKRQTKAAVRPDLRVAAGAYPPMLLSPTTKRIQQKRKVETHEDELDEQEYKSRKKKT